MDCCFNFDSQIAYLIENQDGKPSNKISIIDYLENTEIIDKVSRKELFLVCLNKHELVKVNLETCPHFRHKNSNHEGMCEWHKEWQSNFETTEKTIGDTRADALCGNYVLEFQHSNISLDTVKKREENYKAHRMDLLWILDCSDGISVTNNEESIDIKFIDGHQWKYKNFECCEYIYLDYNSNIYRIKPDRVRSNMYTVSQCKSKIEFIDSIKSNDNVWNDELEQCTLYHNQRGAGCGKTYESIQLLQNDPRFFNKETFIYLSKMHSAKEVIFSELKEQSSRGSLDNLEFEDGFEDQTGKQYKISFNNKLLEKQCEIIIGTVDSFMYCLGNKDIRDKDYFGAIVRSIKNGFVDVSEKGTIKYAKSSLQLNRQCLVIIDEAQDLGSEYIEAVGNIMKKTYIDTYVIGDKLQSIWGEHNIHTFLEKNTIPSVNVIKSTGINQVKRFHNIQFKDFVNDIVPFVKYDLPPIESICDKKDCVHLDDEKPYNVFEIPIVYSNDHNIKKLSELIDKIISDLDYEVNKNNYVPSDFMVIFPILKRNSMANILEERIQNYWINKFLDKEYQDNVLSKNDYWKDKIYKNDFYKYVYFHKSEEGKSINLAESENSTRILSIHASKGTGRAVVFLFGITEYALRVYSKDKNNLQFDSLLHVALTRQKKKIYIGLENNNDEICQRFKDVMIRDPSIPPRIEYIRKTNKVKDIIDYAIYKKFNLIEENIIKPKELLELLPETNNQKSIIEWGHHLIRFCVFQYRLFYNIINGEVTKNLWSKHFFAILNNISTLNIQEEYHFRYYESLNKIKSSKSNNKIKLINFPILRFNASEETKYYKYTIKLNKIIKNIQKKLISSLKNYKLPNLCALESSILWHMIYIMQEHIYSDITIIDIYSLLYYYDEVSHCITEEHKETYDCLCNTEFELREVNSKEKYKDVQLSIVNHYEQINQIDEIFRTFINILDDHYKCKFEFTISDFQQFFGISDNFMIYNKQTLGYSEKYLLNVIYKPQFNKLNFNEVIFESIFNDFLLKNSEFQEKKIITCIFTLDSNEPIVFELNIDKNDKVILECIKNYLLEKYSDKHEEVYNFYQFCKNNKPDEIDTISYVCEKFVMFKTQGYRIPIYIEDYFKNVKRDLLKKRTHKDDVLKRVEDKAVFLEEIYTDLQVAIDEFLNINSEELSDEKIIKTI